MPKSSGEKNKQINDHHICQEGDGGIKRLRGGGPLASKMASWTLHERQGFSQTLVESDKMTTKQKDSY